MESDRPDPLPGFLASSPGSAATFDRPEGRLDQSEGVAPFRPLIMTLRSHSRAGRSKSPNPENVGTTVRTESEHPQPETEDASCAGQDTRKIPDSPDIDSSGETGKLPLDPLYMTVQDRKWKLPPVRPFPRRLPPKPCTKPYFPPVKTVESPQPTKFSMVPRPYSAGRKSSFSAVQVQCNRATHFSYVICVWLLRRNKL